MSRRSLLFMPGNNPGMLINADILGADTVVFDLEDAVALDEKDAARTLVRNALNTLTFKHSEVSVRINPIDSPYWEADLEYIVPAMPDSIAVSYTHLDVYKRQSYRLPEIIAKDFLLLGVL